MNIGTRRMQLGEREPKPTPAEYLHRVHSRALEEFFARRRQQWDLRAREIVKEAA